MQRSDFVSNSSSSSFMVAVAKEDVKSFINYICNKLQDKKSEYHINDIVDRNKAILNYVYNNIRSVYFGSIFLDKKTTKYTEKDSSYDWYKSALKGFKTIKPTDNSKIVLRKNGDIFVTRYDYLDNLTVPKSSYIWSALNMHRNNKEIKEFKIVFNEFLKDVKSHRSYNKYDYNMLDFNTTIINKKTLLNSKYLLDLGYDFKTNGWDIDKLFEFVELDDTVIFKMDIGYEGEGGSYDSLYMENENFWDRITFNCPGIPIDKNTYGLNKNNQ